MLPKRSRQSIVQMCVRPLLAVAVLLILQCCSSCQGAAGHSIHTNQQQWQECGRPWHPLPVQLCCTYQEPQWLGTRAAASLQQHAAQVCPATAEPTPVQSPAAVDTATGGSTSSRTDNSKATSSTSSRQAADKGVCDASSDANSCEHEAEGQYIVRFKDYHAAEAHRQRLRTAIGPESDATWRWVPRHNRAAAHATDFALLSVGRGALPQLRRALQQHGGSYFKDMHPDKRIAGRLKWQPEGALAAAFVDGMQLPMQRQQQQEEQHVVSRSLLQAPGPVPSPGVAPAPAHTDPTTPHDPATSTPGTTTNDNDTAEQSAFDALMRVSKKPGRFTTRSTFELGDGSEAEHGELRRRASRRRRARSLLQLRPGSGVAAQLQADKIWAQGFTGQKVKVAVFDTGIRPDHPHIRHIKQRTNWTHQSSLSDGLGHGTFVAGVIGSQDGTCPGLAPDVEMYTFKVFTDDQVSYTSWFLDAFNYAILEGINVINLSIGGPDFLDQPFVEKIWEVTSNGALMISAIGNDGPLYGTLNNPADQSDVIGVGGIDNSDNIASFSSRGMTTWELPIGTGRVKPDVMAYGKDVSGSKIQGGCRSLSGTSVASPVVAGAVALLASTVPEEGRWDLLNPASMKQALVEGATRLDNLNIYEQGAGRINLAKSQAILKEYKPRASVMPASLDLTDCPYMWPYCRQPLYAYAMPLAFNATLLNGMGVSGRVVEAPVFVPADEGGRLLQVTFEHSTLLWPWSGFLALYIQVSPAGRSFSGIASGTVKLTIESPPPVGGKETAPRRSTIEMPLRARIEPTPPREKRVLWDQFHSVKYPPGYVPRDNLDIKTDILDWHGDHLFTNFHDLYNSLRDKGWFVEVLSSPATCFDARNYGAYLIVDSEEEWYPEEVTKLEQDVAQHGLAVIVFAEWYHLDSMASMKFFDDNTRSWWTPITGGANVPALNDLLKPYGIALGDAVLQGSLSVGEHHLALSYGANIARFPGGGYLFSSKINNVAAKGQGGSPGSHASFGLVRHKEGAVSVFGDANCLDSSHMVSQCFDFLHTLLQTMLQKGSQSPLMPATARLDAPYSAQGMDTLPQRRTDINFTRFSWVLQHPLTCYRNAPCSVRSPSDCPDAPAWRSLAHNLNTPVDTTPGKGAPTAPAGDGAQQPAQPKGDQPTGGNRETTAAEAPPGSTPPGSKDGNQQQQQQQQQQPGGSATGGKAGSHPPEHSEGWKQQWGHQERGQSFISQAMALAIAICTVGVVGIVVLWRKNALKRKPTYIGLGNGNSNRRISAEV